MKLSSNVYDKLKWIAQYLIPALGALYFALAGIWGLPYGEQIIGTLAAIDTFLGVILGLSSSKYNKEFLTYSVPVKALDGVGTVTFTVDPDRLPKNDEEEQHDGN